MYVCMQEVVHFGLGVSLLMGLFGHRVPVNPLIIIVAITWP